MLAALRIESLAILSSLEVRFDRGLNVLTGETGAGKSMLVDALALLLGGRADPGAIRAGCDEAVVEGLFVGTGLGERAAAHGLPAEGDELLVRRTISRNGRSRVHVNGALATVSLLGGLTRGLVDLCGQHEHISLLKRERHLELLDGYAGIEAARLAYERRYAELLRLIRERDELLAAAQERIRRREWLEFQLKELDEVAPEAGEDERLAEERRLLASTERLREVAASVENAIYAGEGAAADLVASALRRLEEAARLDERLTAPVQLLGSARAELDEAGRVLGRYASGLGGDPARLAEIDERLESLRRVARKHGGSLAAARERQAEMRGELERLGGEESRAGSLDETIERLGREVRADAARLSAERRAAAGRFGAAVGEELVRLGLGKASLGVGFSPAEGIVLDEEQVGPRGLEEAEFFFSANAGEEERPLVRAASGGELSRVLLALKRVLSHADPVGIWVFDEVDAGISGATGLVVGQMLRQIARERQVLCVTHLPQVAAHADVHLHVSKEVVGERTHGKVEVLGDGEARQRSLARMLSGSEERPAALAAAAELLETVRERPTRRRRRAA
ncbi:DNA repair protein RecN [Vulgatibacter sp.]|uniref:DNA repair protein RecN n=1 Tax=Vulgatibacter sp. TaxID=1971226 RepID=UPI003563A2FD